MALGLVRGTIVLCLVTAHRGRFGVDVQIISRAEKPPAFIDFAFCQGVTTGRHQITSLLSGSS